MGSSTPPSQSGSGTPAAKPTVVLVALWGVSHFAPMVEVGKRLLALSGSSLTVNVLIVPSPTGKWEAEIFERIRRDEASGLDIRFHHLRAAEPPTDHTGIEEFVSRYVQLYVPQVKAIVSGLTCPVAAVVVDIFCTTLLDAPQELGVPAYVFLISSAAMAAVLLRSPSLDEKVAGPRGRVRGVGGRVGRAWAPAGVGVLPPDGTGQQEDLDIRVIPVQWQALHGDQRHHGQHHCRARAKRSCSYYRREMHARGPAPDGIYDRPGGRHRATDPASQRVPAVARLTANSLRVVPMLRRRRRVLQHAPGARDSTGPGAQWPPLPLGVAWTAGAANLAELLPAGFLEKTKERGLVWPTRAPKKEILAHAAVGGFVTHCGWSSIVESLWFGVPTLPWPHAAEQHFNAFTLVADMGVAEAMKVNKKRNNFVEAAELERAVKALMDDGETARKIRNKSVEMKAACRKAVEHGGSSVVCLERLYDALIHGAVDPKK